MNWNEFVQAKQKLGLDDGGPVLYLSGPQGDNATRYLLETRQNQHEFPNDENIFASFKRAGFVTPDFIWNGRRIRFGGGGGHPALAGTDTVYCAGRIEDGWFWFHSGHYHPKLEHALHFMADFITNSCATLTGEARDTKVNQLAQMNLRIYSENSDTQQFNTTFATEVHHGLPPSLLLPPDCSSSSSSSSSSPPIPIGKSPAIPIGSSRPGFGGGFRETSFATPTPTRTTTTTTPPTTERSRVPESEVINGLGISSYGLQQSRVRIQATPPWIPDSARTKCKCCEKEFSFSRRKHHCRRCGDVVCDACSETRRVVRNPATRPNSTPETGTVRICDRCAATVELA